ncbi:MAG TPA: alkaline phosphatase family protein [Opitutales bacterium]|nr:alkaline phosphatase family protein [Opitutales bacterium]
MSQPTVCILLDAFRPDYLSRTHFLKNLAQTSAAGRLQEPFGFVPRAAYFGGLTPAHSGQTHMFGYSPNGSPFAMASELNQPVLAAIGLEHEGAAKIAQSAKLQLPNFAQTYTSALEIPWKMLAHFAPTELHAPWDQAVGYQSLFHILDAAHKSWLWLGWPQTQAFSDSQVVERAIQSFENAVPDFSFIHLSALDHLGHQHGPGGAQLGQAILQQDRLVEKLLEVFKKKATQGSVLLFGDHGMLPVLRSYNIEAWLQDTGLAYPHDIVYFIDSTMLRIWPQHERARQVLQQHMASTPHGSWLSSEDLERLNLSGINASQGCEHCFVAQPGIMFLPNFFQQKGHPCAGMHGYDPACKDNQGIAVLHTPSTSSQQNLGTLQAHQIFPLLLKLCGFAPEEFSDVTCPNPEPHHPRRYTAWQDDDAAKAEQHIAEQINYATQAIQQIVGEQATIVLGGAYGRAQGGIMRTQTGTFKAVNDYDFWVFCEDAPSNAQQKLSELSGHLAIQFELDFMDIALHTRDNLNQWPATLAHYDLKYGSVVLAGNADILNKFPHYAPAEIPLCEAIILILNRIAGILLEPADYLQSPAPWPRMFRYQLIKSTLALGDAELIRWKDYSPSYLDRAARFQSLAATAGWDAQAIQWVVSAYEHKIDPLKEPNLWDSTLFKNLQQWNFDELARLTQLAADAAVDSIIASTVEAAVSRCGSIETQWAQAAKKFADSGLVLTTPNKHSPKACAYTALLYLYHSLNNPKQTISIQKARAALEALLDSVPVLHSEWEGLRQLATQAWTVLLH